MSYQVLARKWRPKKFQEVIGQEHVTRALQNAIRTNKIGHAYMLVGTRGVGKTSVARIFAKAIRCENLSVDGNSCGECGACLDFDTEISMNVIEIDGASNNSVDNIRELIGNVHYLPTSGRFKVYIIDEVHMLSTNAFNALLKTLEEPPAHVVFVFATTEGQKLLGTVLSRCQRFDFRNVSVHDLAEHAREIAVAEGIKFESDDLIKQLAVLGRGSVRDMLSLLDQVLTTSLNGNITEKNFTNCLGVAGGSSLKKILSFLYSGNMAELSKLFNKLLEENIPVKNIASGLLEELFIDLKTKKDLGEAELIWIYETIARETTWIFNSIAPEKSFEVLLYKATLRRSFFSMEISTQTKDKVVISETVALVDLDEVPSEQKIMETNLIPVPEVVKVELLLKEEISKDLSWEGFLNFLKKKSPASASNLEQGNITSPLVLQNGELGVELGFGYSGLVFYDYLSEPEVFQKLVNNLSLYFEIPQASIRLELIKVDSGTNFISTAAVNEQLDEITKQEQVQNFKNNPILKEAEKMFNAKIDKVIIDNKKL